MANTSISLVDLDFNSLKTNLKTYLKTQKQFQDYDFEGSNMNVLLDLLTHNTYLQTFYLNQVSSEAFLDSAQIRDSVISHSKDLNYTPRSFSSAEATVDILVVSNDSNKGSLTIPKGTKFSSRVDNDTFTFSTNENIVVTGEGSGTFIAEDVKIYEGIYLQETFTSEARIILQNQTVDTNSISVTVLEDNGSTVLDYTAAKSLFGHDENSKVFFLQGAFGNKYEIIFGDGVIGRKPKAGSVVIVEYRIGNGELPNGCRNFRAMEPIDGETNITVVMVEPATGGSIAEDTNSIKFNAPRHFTTQERAVTAEDYENLLKANFSDINAATAFGGEDFDPPVYGRVFVSVDLKEFDSLPVSRETELRNFLKARSPVSIDPVFISPEYIYLKVNSRVKYDINKTSLNQNDLRTIVISAIVEYAQQNLNNFARALRYSRLVNNIDISDASIISNETAIQTYQNLFLRDLQSPRSLKFNFEITGVESNTFKYNGKESRITQRDGILYITNGSEEFWPIGQVDLTKGKLDFDPFEFDSVFDFIEVIVTPKNQDIFSTKNTILNILDKDITVSIERSL